MKTTMLKKEEVRRDWYVVDASGKRLGRLATVIARRLMGKHKPAWTPHVDCGDFIVVVNVDKLDIDPLKAQKKTYHRYTGYPGGKYLLTLQERMSRHPERLFREVVRRMLPKSRLGRKMLRKLKVYAGPEHPHTAQQPKPLEL
ncbi:MAG: 50S ribosomal protein L13 [Planctomycetota bacterium]|nr:MAG: 50S ribosomal protein L13 [Planctomycetota bacterium]